jgi:hypothetical protein
MVSTLSLTLASRYRRPPEQGPRFIFSIVTIGNSNQPLQQSLLLLLLSITTLSKITISVLLFFAIFLRNVGLHFASSMVIWGEGMGRVVVQYSAVFYEVGK